MQIWKHKRSSSAILNYVKDFVLKFILGGETMKINLQGEWILRACAIIITVIFTYGAIFTGWLGMSSKIDNIESSVRGLPEMLSKIDTMESGVKELLKIRAHRIFNVVPEKREVHLSTNPRLFEVEIPPYAVNEPVTFEFDQSPVMPLPAPFSPDYEFLGWAVAFGPETVEFIEPFTAKVELKPEEMNSLAHLRLLYWSKDEREWHEVPIDIEQDRLTGKYLLSFKTKNTGLFALSLEHIE